MNQEGLLTVKLRAYSQSLLHFQPYRLTLLSESETSKLVSSLETAPSSGSRIGRGKYSRILYVRRGAVDSACTRLLLSKRCRVWLNQSLDAEVSELL